MKKIYTLIFGVLLINTAVKAQITLTKAANEPVIGDVDNRQAMDTVNAIPNNSGPGQVWDFSTLTTGTAAAVANTYTTPSSVPGGTAHPTATIAQTDGTSPRFYKSTATTFEMLGMAASSVVLTYTNTGVVANWPITYNYANNDPIAGTLSSSFGNGTFSGNAVVTAPGTGTLLLPGRTYNNVLQLVSYMNINATIPGTLLPIPITATLNITNYQYYDASQKFPLLTVTISRLNSLAGNQVTTTIDVNNNIYAGINEYNLDNSLVIYPNPASNNITIHLNNSNSAKVEIINQFGQVVKTVNIESKNDNINISDLSSGVYFVKTLSENKSSVKKLIKD
ncbi:MAG: T9SS type A sorting domain-containing protein [Bacteroidetes bacterium]|nr:T9SS type A sorting domain-containing protein [Bacteroidota bacterium]